MAIKPILFNTEMVLAILDERKSCTRRLVRTRRKDACGFYITKKADGTFSGIYEYDENESKFDNPLVPPYQPGDTLYVRETWCDDRQFTHDSTPGRYFYKASENENFKWKPSIHMPKEAARIWLKVTDVRVERLQEISAESALAEGADKYIHTNGGLDENMTITSFIGIWNSTIKKSDLDSYGWDANSWVWVIEFERCEKPAESPYAWNDAIHELTKGV